MNSRINKLLCLDNHRKTVHVKGPVRKWEADEVSAIILVHITQMKDSGAIAVASGVSARVMNGDGTWNADATVTAGPGLEEGPATAYATAAIEKTDRTFERYDWTVQTRLVDCSDGEPDQGDED